MNAEWLVVINRNEHCVTAFDVLTTIQNKVTEAIDGWLSSFNTSNKLVIQIQSVDARQNRRF